MLFKGTPTRKPIDITRAIEGRGGNFNAMTGEQATCYFAHLPDDYLGEAVDILSDMYLRATIPADEFAREKQVVIEEIKMYADEPDAVAMENLQRNLFPKSMLGSPVAGSEKSLAPMTPGDLKSYIGTVTGLAEDEHGLLFTATFDSTPEAQRARELAMDGRLCKFSFAYDVIDQMEVELEDGRTFEDGFAVEFVAPEVGDDKLSADGTTIVVAINFEPREMVCPIAVRGRIGRVWRGEVGEREMRLAPNEAAVFEVVR
jgi:hypothetical protein